MKIRQTLPVLALAVALPAAGQSTGSASVASIRPLFEQVAGWVVAGAEKMPESNYAWQPTAEIRTFGALVGHIANASYSFCSSALGEASPSKTNFEEVKTKAELVAGLKAAIAYCTPVYRMNDTKALEMTKVFGQDATRLYALNFNVAHDFEHYGNMVTYLRLKGIVPPSTAG
jgi:uncharacterized damage-inducible protein DinB